MSMNKDATHDMTQWQNYTFRESDQGLHCLQFCLYLLDAFLCAKTTFLDNYINFLGC